MSNYNHPQIFADLLTLYKMYYKSHQNLPKAFRYTISIEIMKEMTDGLRLITLANFKKKSVSDYQESVELIKQLRSKIEVLKSFFLIAWEMPVISHGFYINLQDKLEEISKQAAAWEKWCSSKTK